MLTQSCWWAFTDRASGMWDTVSEQTPWYSGTSYNDVLYYPAFTRRHHLQNSVEILNSLTLITPGDPGLCIPDVISAVYFIIFKFSFYCFLFLLLLLSLKFRHPLNYPLPHQGFLSMPVFSKYCLNFQCSLSLEYIYWLFFSITHFRNTNYSDYHAFLSAHDIQIYTLPFVAYYRR